MRHEGLHVEFYRQPLHHIMWLKNTILIFIFTLLMDTLLMDNIINLQQYILPYTGQPRYVKLAYLEYTAYVEVIIHSRAFPQGLIFTILGQ